MQDLLANDFDVDSDVLTVVSVAGAGAALVDSGQSVELQGGVNSFTYTVSDGHVLTTATANVQQVAPGGTMAGTSADEIFVGTASAETINGGDGRDRIVGGGGNDILNGEASDDIIRGGASDDTIDGGTGMDIIDFSDATAGIDVTLVQSASSTTVNLVAAGLGTDTYRNIEGIFGTAFADTLHGTALNDYFKGGGGNDILIGGGGSDTLTGGAGSDTVKWFNGDIASGVFDTLLDFETGAGGDIIDLSDALSGVSGDKRRPRSHGLHRGQFHPTRLRDRDAACRRRRYQDPGQPVRLDLDRRRGHPRHRPEPAPRQRGHRDDAGQHPDPALRLTRRGCRGRTTRPAGDPGGCCFWRARRLLAGTYPVRIVYRQVSALRKPAAEASSSEQNHRLARFRR